MRPVSGRGGGTSRRASASSSSSSRSRSSAAHSTTCSTRRPGAGDDRRDAAPADAPQAGRPERAAPRRRGPQDLLHARIGDGQGRRRRQLPARPRRGARHRRRVRLRQDDDRAVAPPAPPVERVDRRRQREADGHRPRAEVGERAPALPLARDLDRVPGRDERAQPRPAGPRPDRRTDRGAAGRVGVGGPEARRRAARAGRHPEGARRAATRTSCRAGCASGR